jgi:hypothetical protein
VGERVLHLRVDPGDDLVIVVGRVGDDLALVALGRDAHRTGRIVDRRRCHDLKLVVRDRDDRCDLASEDHARHVGEAHARERDRLTSEKRSGRRRDRVDAGRVGAVVSRRGAAREGEDRDEERRD